MDLPDPGGPVTPVRQAFPVLTVKLVQKLGRAGFAVFHPGNRPRQSSDAAGSEAIEKPTQLDSGRRHREAHFSRCREITRR